MYPDRFPSLLLPAGHRLIRGTLGVLLVVAITGLAGVAEAGPWLDPGDTGLRHDVELLADAGVIRAPVTVWPLSWGDLAADLAPAATADLGPAEAAALVRLNRRSRAARESTRVGGWVEGGSEGWQLRGFEDTPREQAGAGASLEWTGERFATRLVARGVADPEDDRAARADGSYAAMALGNWMLGAGLSDRWWGPGWQGSMILSNNARPVPAFFIDRNSTAPFQSPWLRWIGSFDLTGFWGFLEDDRAVPDARFFGLRLTLKPTRFLELGLSRTAMWCGRGRPCDFDAFEDLLLGRDNAGDNVDPEDEPGNQLAGYDLRLSAAAWGWPVAIYGQMIGEDEQHHRPSLFLTQMGVQTWGGLGGGGSWRAYLEVADTLCGGNIRGDGTANCAYNHPIYATGMRYRGRVLGHSADNDAEVWTLGAILADGDGHSWVLAGTWGDLNRKGDPDPANSVTPVSREYRALSLVHRRALSLGPVPGQLQALAGVESFEDPATGHQDEDWRFQLRWEAGF
jgi:hypothetical protein